MFPHTGKFFCDVDKFNAAATDIACMDKFKAAATDISNFLSKNREANQS
jgi:hypothetical protein